MVALPHCLARAAATTREPVIRALPLGGDTWTELRSEETSFDEHKVRTPGRIQGRSGEFDSLSLVFLV